MPNLPLFLPWWHNRWDQWRGVRAPSGCKTVQGRVQCTPEALRAQAEQKLKSLGVYSGYYPLTTYSLARYIASEVGSGTPEEKVAVAEAALNRVKLEGLKDINSLLLYRVPGSKGYGAYGPIHDPQLGAPFGRWAATSRDPSIDDLLIADFVARGLSANFAKGADDQYGPQIERAPNYPTGWAYRGIPAKAQKGNYWVGPLPGVNHWKTFLFRHRPDIPAGSTTGKLLIAQAQNALSQRPSPWVAGRQTAPNWSGLPVAAPPRKSGSKFRFPKVPTIVPVALASAAAIGLGYVGLVRAFEGRWIWQPRIS